MSIAFQFKKDAAESEKVLKGYSEMEKSENDMYENAKFEDEEFYDYETIEELDESSQGSKAGIYEEVNIDGGSDAVAFLTGILKPSGKEKALVRRVTPKKSSIADSGFDDPNRRHICNVCNKKFQKRSNLIDHLRLHANVKVFSCEVRSNKKFLVSFAYLNTSSTARNRSCKQGTTKLIYELTRKRNPMHVTTATKPTASPAL